jgi:hypothetical protein
MSDCLHCDINALVAKYIEGSPEPIDLAQIASLIAESLAEFILAAPESEQANLMADALAHLGQTFLDKGEAVEPGPHGAH